jgi:hypothetical protein
MFSTSKIYQRIRQFGTNYHAFCDWKKANGQKKKIILPDVTPRAPECLRDKLSDVLIRPRKAKIIED